MRANAGRMGQVVLNLLVNAAEALRDVRGRRIRTSTRHVRGKVTVDVEDDGPGVSDEIASRVFEPFFTTKSTGTGLGLSICQSIVTSFGGTIELGRSEWGGALFRVRLPVT